MWKSTGFLATKYHVTNETVQNWIKNDKFEKVERTKGGHYRIWIEEELQVVLYARVSSKKQESSLIKQQQLLLKKYPNAIFKSDIASGFNQTRRSYRAILESAINGTPQHVVATTSDRITRSGFSLIKWIIELSGGRIELLEEDIGTNEQFDTTTLIAFITSFINSHYGKRSASRRENSTENKNLSKK